MEKLINLETFKESPHIFFEYMPEEAKKEFESLLEFIIFKYNLKNIKANRNIETTNFSLFKENPIKVKKIIKYKRDELHKR